MPQTHRVSEYAVARQQVSDDAADDGAAVNADAHVQTAQMESGGDLRRGLGSLGRKNGARRVDMKRGSGKEQMHSKNSKNKRQQWDCRWGGAAHRHHIIQRALSPLMHLDELKRQAGQHLDVVGDGQVRN